MKRYYLIFFIFLLAGCAIKDEKVKKIYLDLNDSVKIKGRVFMMGSRDNFFGDKKLHLVELDDFYIDKSEVTNIMYKRYLKKDYSIEKIDEKDNLPVVNVNYYEAKKYCQSINKRLPSEAEWEYVARGGLNQKYYPWGDEKGEKLLNDRDLDLNRALRVKSFSPNSYGVYDMSGNVREWVEDSYERYFYNKSPKKNPINKKDTKYRVTRGGSFKYSDGYPSTISFRSFDRPTDRFEDLGFRCAYSLDDNLTKK